ncbi:helix-turn-helix transcriptional regulator [Bilifractor sp. LCP19S3_H10]|uniref:helix-turn-helix transcriptional regulator n=1 Tax=Bilifractor sp. LCP19S3_H10 TaxID=3438736 RepID=UPI003F900F4D
MMLIKELLNEKNMSMYRLAKISGVPKTTVIDICTGKSNIAGCNVGTVYRIAKALGCRMEDLMDACRYDEQTGLPKDQSYLEKGLPPYLEKSLCAMKHSWQIIDNGGKDMLWDAKWCELNADINAAENDCCISRQQADYLRREYLRMENTI